MMKGRKNGSVGTAYLLKGAVYALEQCGLLLRDANILYSRGSYGSSRALAAFAREELGRAVIIFALREMVLSGETVTVKSIREACDDHVTKQVKAAMSLLMRTDKEQGIGKLLEARARTAPGSEERKAADAEID